MRSRQDYLDLVGMLLDVEHHCAKPLVDPVGLTGDLFGPRHERLGASQFDHQRTALPPQGLSGNDLASHFEVLFVYAAALGVTNPLDDDLLGRLGRDPTKRANGHFLTVDAGGDIACLAVYRDLDPVVAGVRIGFANGRQHSRFQIVENHVAIDISVAGEPVYQSNQFLIHGGAFLPSPRLIAAGPNCLRPQKKWVLLPTLQLDETRWKGALHPSLIAGAHQRSRRWPTPAVPDPWRDDRFAEQTGPYTDALAWTLFTQSVTGQLPGKTYQTIEFLTDQRAIIDTANPQSIKKLQE